jgi:hypothetical protein
MRNILFTITVAMLVTACSGVQSFRTNGAADVELNDEENRPSSETESDAELQDGEGLELPESPLGDGEPQYAESFPTLEIVGC